MNELVSIIIPIYNRADILAETLDSIILQTYKEFECILVDDDSSDNSIEVANSFVQKDSRFKFFKRPSNLKKGACNCRNYGYQKSSGTFIQWFDSDDIMLPTMLEEKINALTTYGLDVVSMASAYFTNNISITRIDKSSNLRNVTDNPAFEIISTNFSAITSQVMFRKSFLNTQKRLFNNNLLKNQETEFFVRIFLSNPTFDFIENRNVLIRSGHHSISSVYNTFDESKKRLINIIAYFEMYHSFKNANRLTSEIKIFFNNFFYKCLTRMEVERVTYLKLFVWGIYFNWFPSKRFALKIFLKRYFFSKQNL
jgi:glycosyltransferase involved in cell wall biosynthesis